MTTEQDAKSKLHLRLLGRSIGLPSEAREVIEIVWKAAAEFFQAQQPMPAWMQYEPVTDVLTIHGKKYAASLFGNSGFLGNAGDILRIEQGSDDVVTVTKIEPEQADKFATGGLRKNYIPPIPIWAGLGQHPMKQVPPVQPDGEQFRGYALLGSGKYMLNHSDDFHPELGAELIITLATEKDKEGNRQIGETRDNPDHRQPIQPEDMVVRIGFLNERGLFALENQLAEIRKQFFADDKSPASAHQPAEAVRELVEALNDFSNYVHAEQSSTDGHVQYSNTQINRLAFKARSALKSAKEHGL